MKIWKKYLPGAALAVATICALFFFGLNKKEAAPGAVSSQQKTAAETDPEQFYFQEDAMLSSNEAFSHKMTTTPKDLDISKNINEDSSNYIEKTDAQPHDKATIEPFDDNRRKNIEEAVTAPPEMARLTKDYNIPKSKWEPIFESFVSIRNFANKQETVYKSSKLMDMGTTMLLNRDYEKAEQAFRAVIRIDADRNAVKWARVGLVQSLAGQGENDEAQNEKDISMALFDSDEAFLSLLKNLPVN